MKKLQRGFLRAWRLVCRFFEMVMADQLSVYAAQATFFIMVSTPPFVILVFEIAKYVVNVEGMLSYLDQRINGEIGDYVMGVIEDIVYHNDAYLLSITIVAILWSASRGVNAVTRGVSEAYGVHLKEIFILDILRSLIYTVAFIALIIVTLLGLVFAESIISVAKSSVPALATVLNIIRECSFIPITLLLTAFFALVFNMVAKKGRRFSRSEYRGLSDKLPRGYLAQLPGAGFAALGWVLFSYFFSLYLRCFPDASYLYGSLTTLMLLMLWIYSCMFIFMMGAEVNKLVFSRWNIGKIHKEYVKKKKDQRCVAKSASLGEQNHNDK